jgi:hypothetical protein
VTKREEYCSLNSYKFTFAGWKGFGSRTCVKPDALNSECTPRCGIPSRRWKVADENSCCLPKLFVSVDEGQFVTAQMMFTNCFEIRELAGINSATYRLDLGSKCCHSLAMEGSSSTAQSAAIRVTAKKAARLHTSGLGSGAGHAPFGTRSCRMKTGAMIRSLSPTNPNCE